VVLPIYNRRQYCVEAIESILSQSFGDFERRYPHLAADLARNYLIGWDELGLPLWPVFRHSSFAEKRCRRGFQARQA